MNAEKQDAEWRALLDAGDIRFQKCNECSAMRHPARWICPECLSEDWQWGEVGGGATVEYCVRYAVPFDSRGPEAPYDVAIVRLDEGPRITTNLLGADTPEGMIGARCRIEIGKAPDGSATVFARLEGAK